MKVREEIKLGVNRHCFTEIYDHANTVCTFPQR